MVPGHDGHDPRFDESIQNAKRYIGDNAVAHNEERVRSVIAGSGMSPAGSSGTTPGRAFNRVAYNHVNLDNVEHVFTYQTPDIHQVEAFARVREACISAARTILREVPDCADRSAAIRALREARLWANSAIALRGEV